jgi:hypothetical protein
MVNVLTKIGSDFEIPKRKQIGGPLLGYALGLPNIVTKKVYMRTITSSGNDRFGAKQNMTKREHDRWHQTEHDKKEKWRAAGALRIFCFFLVYVD